MPVRFENFEYSFTRKGKPVFAPSARGRRVGIDIKGKIEDTVDFPDFYYHLRSGGHVAALHAHRPNRFFARMDIERFFYSIGRNRIAHALKDIGIERSSHYARWSTVKNPFEHPKYALPYGFVQSPIVATLVLDRSPLGAALRALAKELTVSVYVDDISLSSGDQGSISSAFQQISTALVVSGFNANADKTQEPTDSIEIFNCDLLQGTTKVSPMRIAAFEATEPIEVGRQAFDRYCLKVESGNV